MEAGKTLAVVGESGCGKSTLARALTLIEEPSSGSLKIAGQEVAGADKAQRKQLRKDVQMVFQSPYASLNPRQKVGDQLGEPLLINTNLSAAERREKVQAMMKQVGLRPEHYQRYPHMFSGGQRQRIALAHDREGLAGFELERHTVECAHQGMALEQATGHFVVTGQVAGGKYDGHYATSWFSG
jgi:dipeptide transport system ATP-binding protein